MDSSVTLNEQFFAPLMATMLQPRVIREMRGCGLWSDAEYLKMGVCRVVENAKSGREWIQQIQQLHGLKISSTEYFFQLASPRRFEHLKAVTDALESTQRPGLCRQTDRLAHIEELRGIEIWAIDAHSIEHACHDRRVTRSDGSRQYVNTTHVYATDLRTGWVRPMALCRGDENELHALKALPAQSLKMNAVAPTICIYDRGGIDLCWWLERKAQQGIGFISRMKANMRPMSEIPIAWDHEDPRNQGVIADEFLGFNNIGMLRRVTYQDPESDEIFEFLTTEMTLPPGVIALLYRLRWDLEKTFNEFKNKLGQQKAWATNRRAKLTQSHFIAITFNLLLLLQAAVDKETGLREVKLERKYEDWVDERRNQAEKAGRNLNEFVFSVRQRATEHSQQFIRWLRNHLRRASTLAESLGDLAGYLFAYV